MIIEDLPIHFITVRVNLFAFNKIKINNSINEEKYVFMLKNYT